MVSELLTGVNPIPVIIGIIVVVILLIIASGYVKAPPDIAYIISGLKKKPKILIGRAGIKIPFLERKDTLLVRQISVDIKTGNFVPTKDYIGVKIDAIAKIRVMTDPVGIESAMRNFLNMNEQQIVEALTDSLQGNMREIVGTVTLDELCRDRKKFGDGIQEKAQDDMTKLGIEIISCNIQEIEDEQKLIPQLGQDNMSQIQKNASIAKAEADRDVQIAQARAAKEANEERVNAETAIAEKQNDFAIKRAELKKAADIKSAEANAAGQIEAENQRRTIGVAATEADIAKQEREIELKQRQADVREQELAATVRKQADAEKYKIEQESQAELYRRQREAEAKRFEKEQEAQAAKISAEAQLFAKEQEAKGIAAVGQAEAQAIEAKGLAEAQAIDAKAEAMKKYGEAAMLEMVVKMLPDMAAAIAKPLESVDKITIIDGGGESTGVESMGGYVPGILKKTIESVKETTGLDLVDVMKSSTIQAKTDRNVRVNLEGTGESGARVNIDIPAEE
ncbi:MAG: flotillin family protein [Lachnospiraceae bacterium]|nr:flotillin family protein [Lachnospiraceae bacterium]